MKKIFVIILSAIMVLTFMPSMAFATEDETDPQGIDLTGAVITLEQDTFTYDGTAHTPVVKSVVKGTDTIDPTNYEVSYINNTNAGKKTKLKILLQLLLKKKMVMKIINRRHP